MICYIFRLFYKCLFTHKISFLSFFCSVFLSGCSLFSFNSEQNNDYISLKERKCPNGNIRASLMPLYSAKIKPSMLPALVIPNNVEVKRELLRLTGRERRLIERALLRKHEYHSVLDELLVEEGVPSDIIGLAVIESVLDRHAKSRAGAVGMWQFMQATAKQYGLRVDSFDDERKDPILSTIAAGRLIHQTYETFRNWELTLAAYNAGCSSVKRQIELGKEVDFWSLSRRGFFNRETRTFVPRVLAAAAILRDPAKYGFKTSY